MVIASVITRFRKFFHTLFIPDHQDSAYLTGIRAYAALFVFLIHSNGLGLSGKNTVFDNFVNQGGNGVIIFFVLSGYVISKSILKAGNNFNLVTYWQRRALRILPLYFLVIIVLAGFDKIWPNFTDGYWQKELGAPHDLKSVIYHLTFYNLIDQRYLINGIGIEWTIPVEFTFYLLIPIWIWSFQRKIHWAAGLLVSGIFYFLSYNSPNLLINPTHDFPPEYLMELKRHWSPYTYMPYFLLASVLAYMVDKYKIEKEKNGLFILLPLSVFILAYGFVFPPSRQQAIYGLITLMVIGGCLEKSKLRSFLLENPFAIMIGKISFSFYLLHSTLLTVLPISKNPIVQAISALLITIILSCISYGCIEMPLSRLRLPYSKKQGCIFHKV